MSFNEFKPRVIIRTSIGSKNLLMVEFNTLKIIQKMFRDVLTEVEVVNLLDSNSILRNLKKL